MDKDLWIVALFLGVLLLSAALIVWMFLSLLRSELEDERRQLIRHGGRDPHRGDRDGGGAV